MLAAVDVQYEGKRGCAACVTFQDWTAAEPVREYMSELEDVLDYEPGEFWKRELPCILAVLPAVDALDVVLIDGYVWLDGNGRPGLGARLFEALGKRIGVVGVAKTAFQGSTHAVRVLRPGSRRPLFVTSAGVDLDKAAAAIGTMAGSHRIPALLKRVDQLARNRK